MVTPTVQLITFLSLVSNLVLSVDAKINLEDKPRTDKGAVLFRGYENPGKIDRLRTLNSAEVNNCLNKVENIKDYLLSKDDTCLAQLCPLERKLVSNYPQTKALLLTACHEKLYLRESSTGCIPKNILNKKTNKHTNVTVAHKENSAIADCTVKSRRSAINGASAQINPAFEDKELSSKESTSTNVSSALDDGKNYLNSLLHSTTRNSALHFLDIPRGNNLKIEELKLDKEYLLFEAFSSLMAYLLPDKFPIDVLRDSLKNKLAFYLWAFQVVKLEILVVVWIIFWAILSLSLPVGVMVSFCFSTNIRRLNEEFSNESLGNTERWTENTLGCLLHVLLLLHLCPVILILAGNEQISRSIAKAPVSASVIYDDINTFIRNSHMQMSFVATSSTDIAIDAIRKDLEDIDTLLGIPYQQNLSMETGMDVALIALDELKDATAKVTSIVSKLLNDCEAARKAGSALQEELQDVARQLVVIQQQCGAKDRPLCFTLQFSGFDVSLPLNNLTHDNKIQQLDGINKKENFNSSIQMARKSYSAIPDHVALETAQYIADIKAVLNRKRSDVYKSAHDLDVLARTLSEEISSSQKTILSFIKTIAKWDLWRWLAILVTTAIVALTWGLLFCGAPCGCGLTSKTVPLLISGICLSCLICLVIWSLGTVSFLIGGHGQSLICRPLYDQHHYDNLGELMDSGGILYGEKGFLEAFGRGNDSVKVADVLKDCQRDQPVYETFHLHNRINLEKVINYNNWSDLKSLFENLTMGKITTELLNPALQLNLQILSALSSTNFTTYRLQMSSSVTKRDLGSFADQLNTVARQLADPVSSRKIDNLAYNIRKVIHKELQRLNDIRDRILHKITTLEVLLVPLNRQVNQSLSHLKTIQFFLDNQEWQIAERTRRQFIARIENYLEDLYVHATAKVTKEIGKCRPLWEIFHSSRFYVCKLIVDPLNGIAFASFFMILLFIATTPVVVKLVDFYRESHDVDFLSSISHRHARNGLIIDDECTWASPLAETPPEQRGPVEPGHPTTWVSPPPRPSSVCSRIATTRIPQIPTIVRSTSKSKLSSLASRIAGSRNLVQIPSISRARTPRRRQESLKLIEPVHWKSGSTTPRSWI